MDFKAIQALTANDMAEVDAKILAQLNSDVALINQLGFYIVSGGGKRLRPILAVLAARALGYEGNKHTTAAAFIEFTHTATLLHDDVVDESDMRRGGKETANAMFGNAASVLVGGLYLYPLLPDDDEPTIFADPRHYERSGKCDRRRRSAAADELQ